MPLFLHRRRFRSRLFYNRLAVRDIYLYPKFITRGSRVSYSSMDTSQSKKGPDHLLILVHGIMASSSDWTYGEAVLKRRLGDDFFIYASSSNIYTKTFDGIDVAGRRLANEVLDVIRKTDGLRKISFLAHSLGGLFARYAISILYSTETNGAGQSGVCSDITNEGSEKSGCTSGLGAISELEPINFITLATPHLGVRGKNQLAAPLAPLVVGRTGAQLFLTDGEPSKPPLLLQMASDHEEKKFISALAAFKNRILYANVSYDRILPFQLPHDFLYLICNIYGNQKILISFKPFSIVLDCFLDPMSDMVGWRTSSIRREEDLTKPSHRSLDGYKHIVNMEYCSPISSDGPHFPLQAARAKEAAQNRPNGKNTEEYHEMMEEEMIHGLQRVGWKKVDVNFHTALWPYLAHNNIHVKNEWLHSAGAGVIDHVADSIKQQESRKYFPAKL
uniref:DUF676 domain-containing protein n=1 Tax=Leersia perrieri TaxID=77586 RepID=A0A0D9WM27_9ORYZ